MPQFSLATPLGILTLSQSGDALSAVHWETGTTARQQSPTTALLREAAAQITAYFAARLCDFALPLAPAGSPFQRRLWRSLQEIPYGETRSYGDIAHQLDSGPRAVGGACGRNPLPLLIPCHRVLAAGQRLGGYSGAQGLATKRFLLDLEGARYRGPVSRETGNS